MRICVTGASGFIGHHLCRYLRARGHSVIGVDVQPRRHFAGRVADQEFFGPDNDLRDYDAAAWFLRGVDQVYTLAANMGGAGFVFTGDHDWEILRDNTQINLNVLQAAVANGVKRVLYTSSACVYPEAKQADLDAAPLAEADAYPAGPDSEYGWEKLYTERLCAAMARATGVEVRIARFHNIYGPEGSWCDGREKVPAAACRKVTWARLSGENAVEVWGDGEQIRSFCYIDDCLEMLVRLMESDHAEPLNVGTDEAVSVNEVFRTAAQAAGADIVLKHIPGPQGVRARNADLSEMRRVLGYEPRVSFAEGMARTQAWIEQQMRDIEWVP
jgi:GDP-D-mannose 3', 5'-epimerase